MKGGEDGRSAARDQSLRTILVASAGLFGIQVVWGLQNVSTSRIFQTLGAEVADLPMLWIAAPLTGLLVQPIVGHLSDRSRSRFGRRRPFIAVGALFTALGMLALGFAQTLQQAVAGLWLLTASANVTMQPLRALLADLLPAGRRATGYAIQVVLIGSGAVLASALPWLLGHVLTADVSSSVGHLPQTVHAAFAIGAALVLITGFASLFAPDRRGPPAPQRRLESAATRASDGPLKIQAAIFLMIGVILAGVALAFGLRREIYLLALICVTYGVAVAWLRARRRSGEPATGPLALIENIALMPPVLRRLALVQFFTWFGLFTLWVYAVPAVAARESERIGAAAYNASADRVGLFFALFDAVAILAALALPWLVRRAGLVNSHQLCLVIGGAGLAGLALMPQSSWSWIPAIGVGIAWASILSAPYTLVANGVPPDKVGAYLGIHNIFLVVPQLVAATTLGLVTRSLQSQSPVAMVWLAAIALLLGAISCATLRGSR